MTQHAWPTRLLWGDQIRGHKLGNRETIREAVVQVKVMLAGTRVERVEMEKGEEIQNAWHKKRKELVRA